MPANISFTSKRMSVITCSGMCPALQHGLVNIHIYIYIYNETNININKQK